MKDKYTIDEIWEGINEMLKRFDREENKFRNVKEIEKKTNIYILHKLKPIIRKYYNNNIPFKISRTEAQILIGELRKEEFMYRKRKEMLKKGQKKLNFYLKSGREVARNDINYPSPKKEVIRVGD